MPGVFYTVSFAHTTIAQASGDYDLCELTPAANAPIEVVGYSISITSELGDAQEEFLQCGWYSDNATSGNGTATTPRPTNSRGPAADFTAETVASTPASTGTVILIEPFNVPSRGGTGGPIWYPSGLGPKISAADTMLCCRLLVAVTDDVTMAGCFWVLTHE